MLRHPFHIVDSRPWPLSSAMGVFLLASGLAMALNNKDHLIYLLGLLIVLATLLQWWRDVSRESTMQGKHTNKVEDGIRLGMLLFILSEVLFFFTFFWAFFHASLSVGSELGGLWPPKGVDGINPLEVPLLNTTLLLSSGATITWTHIAIMNTIWSETHCGFAATVVLGATFTFIQGLEYMWCSFTITDSVLGRTFYIATGFHGLHVVIGTIFIAVRWLRHHCSHFSPRHHIGFEASAWYWHFVDVVWLLLFICIYWWGF